MLILFHPEIKVLGIFVLQKYSHTYEMVCNSKDWKQIKFPSIANLNYGTFIQESSFTG